MKKLSLILLFMSCLCSCFAVSEDKEWVEEYLDRYPEILWLADSQVRKTEEGEGILQGSFSEQFFGKKYVEFDRTLMTLSCLRLFLDGSDSAYERFVASQPIEDKLKRESFNTLHQQGEALLNCGRLPREQMVQLMETALVLGDMGKSEKARELFKPYGVTAPDQDDFCGEAMKILDLHPSLSSSFVRLPCSGRELLVKIVNLIHYGHVSHLEGGVKIFTKMKESSIPQNDPVALSFDLFIHACDVAGALGHLNNHSSLVYTEWTHRGMQAMAEAVKVLADPTKNEWDAYYAYLQVRANWLGLNPDDNLDRILTRLGAMLRLFTEADGVVLRKGVANLECLVREKIIMQLDARTVIGRTPTYIPATLVNLSNNLELGQSKEERLIKAIEIGLPFIAKVLEKHKQMILEGQIDSQIPLNFNQIAGVAKKTPYSLNGCFKIDNFSAVSICTD